MSSDTLELWSLRSVVLKSSKGHLLKGYEIQYSFFTLALDSICQCRHCRRQIFANGVNFSIFTHFLFFFPLKLLKLGEIDGVKFLAWKSGSVNFWTNSMLVYGCVSSHVSKLSSLPRISHGAQAREAKVLSRSQPLRSTNSETTFIVQTFAKYGLYQHVVFFQIMI